MWQPLGLTYFGSLRGRSLGGVRCSAGRLRQRVDCFLLAASGLLAQIENPVPKSRKQKAKACSEIEDYLPPGRSSLSLQASAFRLRDLDTGSPV